MQKEKVLFVDGNAFFYRAYYGSLALLSRGGKSMNAVYTSIRMLKKFLQTRSYKAVLFFFDKGKNTWRHQQFIKYKINRQKTPVDLIKQIPLFKVFLKKAGIQYFEDVYYEADDLIASAIRNAHARNYAVDIVSTDRDLLQLIDTDVSQILPKKGMSIIQEVNIQNFYSLFSFYPHQVSDWKALTGDKSDNIPGVKGIGPRTALKSLSLYGNLETIYQHLNIFSPKLRKLLQENEKEVFFYRKLTTLNKNIDLKIDFSQSFPCFDGIEVNKWYEKVKMFSLLKKKQSTRLSNFQKGKQGKFKL